MASHCLIGESQVIWDKHTVEQVLEKVEGAAGIAVVSARLDGEKFPSLKLGRAPKPGALVASVGFGGGSPQPLWYMGLISLPKVRINEGAFQMAHTATAMEGMSGGPILDAKGKVVGIILGGFAPGNGPATVTLSPAYEELKRLFDKWGG